MMTENTTVMTKHLFSAEPVDNVTFSNDPDWVHRPISVVVEVDQSCVVASKLAGKVKLDESVKREIAHRLADNIVDNLSMTNLEIQCRADGGAAMPVQYFVRVDVSVGPTRRI